jgi:nitrous oxidase accessory protein NosD
MEKYRSLGTMFNRLFRNDLNANFTDIDTDIQAQKKRVDDLIIGTPQPSEVVDARLGFPVLRDKLSDVDAQLADIVTNVKSFGAEGDGVTDDSTAIQNAINSLDRYKGGTIFFPANSVYYITKPIVINKDNITIECNGSKIIMAGSGVFQAVNSTTYPYILNNSNARCTFIADGAPEYVPVEGNKYDPACYSYKLSNITIKNLTIQCGTGDGNFMGISLGLIDNLRIDNVQVLDSKGNGIEVKKCVNPIIYNCKLINCSGFSLFLYKTKNATVERCYFRDAKNWVLEIKHSYNAEMWVNAYVNNNVFENISPSVSDPVCIRGGGGYDSHGGTGADPDGFNHRFVFGCTVTNNTFKNCNAVAIQPTLHSGRWTVKNNKLINHQTAGIKVEGSNSLGYYTLTGGHIVDGNIIEFVDDVVPTISNAGIAITSPNCFVINNEIRKSLYSNAIYPSNTENVTIQNNKLVDSVYPSGFANTFIRTLNIKGLTIKDNKVQNVKTNSIGDMTAILLNGVSNFEVSSNNLTGITHVTSLSFGTAITLLGVSSEGLIANNNIKYATTGIKDDGDTNSKTNVLIRDNIITNSRTITDNYKITYSKFLTAGGTTANRPSTPFSGMQYFDISLGGKLIVFNGSAWVNVDGSAL